MARPYTRQHIVPQFFLRRFSRNGKLRLVERDETSKWRLRGVNEAMFENFFYDAPLEGRDDWWVENELGKLELRVQPAFKHLDDGIFPPNDDDMLALRTLIALGLVRGFRLRHQAPHAWDATLREPLPALAQVKDGARLVFNQEISDAEAARITEALRVCRDAGLPMPPGLAATLTPTLAARLADVLAARTWHLLTFDQPVLLTGDQPVALNHDELRAGVPLGLGSCDEVIMPIDSHRAIFLISGITPEPRKTLSASAPHKKGGTVAQRINSVVASQSLKWLVHHPDIDPVAELFDIGIGAGTLVNSAV